MNTRNLLRKLPSCLLGAIFAAGVASTMVSTMANAVDGNPPGLFELEGDFADAPFDVDFPYTVGDDWESLHLGTNNGSPIATTEDPVTGNIIVNDPAPQSIYTQGGSKDVNDVSQWKHTNGAVPDKDNITHAYAAAYKNQVDVGPHKVGDLIIYFGLDRFANNGDAFAGFWFFQNEVSLNADGTFNGVHVAMRDDPDSSDPTKFLPGDMFVNVDYPQASGAVPIIRVYQWDPLDADGDGNVDPDEKGGKFSPLDLVIKSTDAECDQSGNKLACAITNLQALSEPAWGYTPKSGSGMPLESFFEGGINVTQLLGTTPCFASFLAESRSAASQTAQLKDFVLAQFPICGIDVVKDCDADLNAAGTGVDVSFTGTLENTGGSSYIAYLKDDQSGSEIDRVCVDTGNAGCADDADVANLVLQTDGSAYFPLAGDTIVTYEGHYSVSGLPPIPVQPDPPVDPPLFAMNDEVTALAFSKVEDAPAPGEDPDPILVIVSDSDTAGCNYQFTAELGITKVCDLIFDASTSTASVTITGTVTNSGNVPLENLTLTDSDFGAVTLAGGVTTLAPGASTTFEKTQLVAKDALDPVVTGPVNGVSTVTLTHKDTITVEGEVLDSNDNVIGGDDAVSEEAVCTETLTNGILVEKNCTVGLDIVNGFVVVKVTVEATVSNTGTETLTIDSLIDDPVVNFGSLPATLVSGANFVRTGFFYPSTSDTLLPGSASFSDTVDVTAHGAFSQLSASDDNTATCDLCPD